MGVGIDLLEVFGGRLGIVHGLFKGGDFGLGLLQVGGVIFYELFCIRRFSDKSSTRLFASLRLPTSIAILLNSS